MSDIGFIEKNGDPLRHSLVNEIGGLEGAGRLSPFGYDDHIRRLQLFVDD
ncbi:MAG: hypothetical protein ACRD3J_12010 [Thermoanaerobaculia bacterium]